MFDELLDTAVDRIVPEGPLQDARRAIWGGCVGLLLTPILLFVFFVLGLALVAGVDGVDVRLSSAAAGPILCLGMVAIANPIIGFLWGLRDGYRAMTHCGCLVVYLGVIIVAVVALSSTAV